jgi:hypothetical protein
MSGCNGTQKRSRFDIGDAVQGEGVRPGLMLFGDNAGHNEVVHRTGSFFSVARDCRRGDSLNAYSSYLPTTTERRKPHFGVAENQ